MVLINHRKLHNFEAFKGSDGFRFELLILAYCLFSASKKCTYCSQNVHEGLTDGRCLCKHKIGIHEGLKKFECRFFAKTQLVSLEKSVVFDFEGCWPLYGAFLPYIVLMCLSTGKKATFMTRADSNELYMSHLWFSQQTANQI